jgi:hypothetical protein
MPIPCTRGTPYFAERPDESLTDFLVDYDVLAIAHRLTDAQKVNTLSRYIPAKLRGLWQSLDGYATGNWATYRTAIEAIYPDTSAATCFTKKALHELVDSWAGTPM